MSYGSWRPYVPVAKRREDALKLAAKAKKAGKDFNPVVIEGRTIAKTFWGKAWCDNLEAYSDYANRLPRGRSYARNGSIVDLAIGPGKVNAQVMGSSLYKIEISISPVSKGRWSALIQECTGTIASLVELLQGKFSKGVMERICHPDSGLFPAPKEISLSCSCPDWATMCKHVAAVLYGVGARLDSQPELLFTLRQVAATDLITEAARLPVETKKAPAKGRRLEDGGLDDLFGIEMAETLPPASPVKSSTDRGKSLSGSSVKVATKAGGTKTKAPAKAKATPTPVKAKVKLPAPTVKPPATPGKSVSGSSVKAATKAGGTKTKAPAKAKATPTPVKAKAKPPAPTVKSPAGRGENVPKASEKTPRKAGGTKTKAPAKAKATPTPVKAKAKPPAPTVKSPARKQGK
ncbi:MAG: SWIM zinc finger family protein [Leptospirillia bacterium]